MPDLKIELGVMRDSKTGLTSYSIMYRVGAGNTYYLNRFDLADLARDLFNIATKKQGIAHPSFVVQPLQDKSYSNMALPPQDTLNKLESLLRDPATLAAYAAIPDASPVSSDF